MHGVVGPVRPRTHGKAWMYEKHVCWPACFDCFEAARKHRKRIVYTRDSGKKQLRVEAEPVREMVRSLVRNRKYSIGYISRQTGIHRNTLKHYIRASSQYPMSWVLSGTADRVTRFYRESSGTPVANTKFSNLVDVRLTRIAIRGLMRQGWDSLQIAEGTGMSDWNVLFIARGKSKMVKVENERAVVDFARKVGSSEGGCQAVKTRAEQKGWLPTIMFDELL